jgi:hypothetical protein
LDEFKEALPNFLREGNISAVSPLFSLPAPANIPQIETNEVKNVISHYMVGTFLRPVIFLVILSFRCVMRGVLWKRI